MFVFFINFNVYDCDCMIFFDFQGSVFLIFFGYYEYGIILEEDEDEEEIEFVDLLLKFIDY